MVKSVAVVLTPEIRKKILAQRGVLSLAETARQFNTSRRTVGRIFDAGATENPVIEAVKVVEPLLPPEPEPSELVLLREHVAALAESVAAMALQLSNQPVQQRPRVELNPAYYGKEYKASAHDYSSPYRDSPGTRLQKVHGEEVPIPYIYNELESKMKDDYFKFVHPASPDCLVFPYQYRRVPREPAGEVPQNPVVFKDPPVGKPCICSDCVQWRKNLAFEEIMSRAYIKAVCVDIQFRNRHR